MESTESRANDILQMMEVTKAELFAAPSNSVVLLDEKNKPLGEVYCRGNRVGVRFGDYKPSIVTKVLDS